MFTGLGVSAWLGVRELVSDDQGALGNSYKGGQSASEVTLILGSSSVALGRAQQNSFQFAGPAPWGLKEALIGFPKDPCSNSSSLLTGGVPNLHEPQSPHLWNGITHSTPEQGC